MFEIRRYLALAAFVVGFATATAAVELACVDLVGGILPGLRQLIPLGTAPEQALARLAEMFPHAGTDVPELTLGLEVEGQLAIESRPPPARLADLTHVYFDRELGAGVARRISNTLVYTQNGHEYRWEFKTEDSSTPDPGHAGVEIAGPVLWNESDLHFYLQVMGMLASHGLRPALGAGVHVHLGWRNPTLPELALVTAVFGRLDDSLAEAVAAASGRRTSEARPLDPRLVAAMESLDPALIPVLRGVASRNEALALLRQLTGMQWNAVIRAVLSRSRDLYAMRTEGALRSELRALASRHTPQLVTALDRNEPDALRLLAAIHEFFEGHRTLTECYSGGRTRALNLLSLFEHGTTEIRIFNSSVRPSDLATFADFASRLSRGLLSLNPVLLAYLAGNRRIDVVALSRVLDMNRPFSADLTARLNADLNSLRQPPPRHRR